MRFDNDNNTKYQDRTVSENVERTQLGGFNLIKLAKYINIMIGVALIVIVILAFVSFQFLDVFGFMLTLFQGVFGLVIIASSFQMVCVRRNFLFLMTGLGKGFFNILVGITLFFNSATLSPGYFMAWIMLAGGSIFIFLSRFRQISDEDINRAVSIQKKSVFNAVGNVAQKGGQAMKNAVYDNREQIAQTAYDNREVIAQTAYDNRELIAQTAYDNREMIAKTAYDNREVIAQ